MSADIRLRELVCSTLAEVCNETASRVTPATRLVDLDIDSMTLISVLARVEATFGFEIPPEDMAVLLEAVCVQELIEPLTRIVESR